jgi:hypothetical protein
VISPNVEDTPELTRAIMLALAAEAAGTSNSIDYAPFHSLQRLIAIGTPKVRVPFANAIARATNPRAVRLRRDFGAVLGLVRGHALLHQFHRNRSDDHIIADRSDYAAVHRLVAELVAEGAEHSVPKSVRETVDAVFKLELPPVGYSKQTGLNPVRVQAVADALGISRPSASRRLARAESLGYIKDISQSRAGPKTFETSEHMPSDTPVLPSPDEIA